MSSEKEAWTGVNFRHSDPPEDLPVTVRQLILHFFPSLKHLRNSFLTKVKRLDQESTSVSVKTLFSCQFQFQLNLIVTHNHTILVKCCCCSQLWYMIIDREAAAVWRMDLATIDKLGCILHIYDQIWQMRNQYTAVASIQQTANSSHVRSLHTFIQLLHAVNVTAIINECVTAVIITTKALATITATAKALSSHGYSHNHSYRLSASASAAHGYVHKIQINPFGVQQRTLYW